MITGSVTPGGAGASIVEVTINGVRVPALDSNGNFFAPIDVIAGSQNFTIATTNSAGMQASTTITVTGFVNNSSQLTVNNSSDITTSAALRWSSTSYNRALGRLLADVQLINTGSTPIDATVAARFDSMDPARVALVNPDVNLALGAGAGSRPAMLFDTELGSQGLAATQISQPLAVAFDVSQLDRFTFDVTLLARTNRPPRFISVPDPQATIGETYRTRVEAVDPDGSRLNYSLLTAPAG